MLTKVELNVLLHSPESTTLDFKQQQYTFYGATRLEQSELLKDILAFANAWKTAPAYILIGAQEQKTGPATLLNVTEHLKDNDIQQFVNSKTNIPIHFLCGRIDVNGVELGYIRIECDQERPVFLLKDFERLKRNVVYVRRGSSTDEADPSEIASMGAAAISGSRETPLLDLQFSDYEKREPVGRSIRFVTRKLSFKKREIVRSPRDNMLSDVLESSMERLRMYQPHSEMMRMHQPDPADVRRYHQSIAATATVGLVLTNNGTIPAKNIRVELFIQGSEDFRVFNHDDYPEYPQGLLSGIASFRNQVSSDFSVEKVGNGWIAQFERRNVQAKAQQFTDPHLHFRPFRDTTALIMARIYADELAKPEEFEMTLALTVEDAVESYG